MGFEMANYSEILVLIANGGNATLCANTDGVTRFLRAIDRVLPANDTGDAMHIFACELMMALCRGMDEHAYEGVVIFADALMMKQLRQVQTSTVSRALLAEVVGTPSQMSPVVGLIANPQLNHQGVVH
jgi:hypothetical protein